LVKFINPITDICWSCLFPLSIGPATVNKSLSSSDPGNPKDLICLCKKSSSPVPVPGVPIGFWEPVRMVDVTRTPYCLVGMGGLCFSNSSKKGTHSIIGDQKRAKEHSFYHVHWYIYPVIFWLELLVDFACLDTSSVDIAYLTEFDPMWGDDAKSAIINPEAILFGNPLAQGACITDCAKSSLPKGTPLDSLFWCCGCQGSMYPYTGTMTGYNGGVQASTLLASRMIAKLHREFLLWATWGKPMISNRCVKYPKPLLDKSAYRLQMTFPIPETKQCRTIGETEVTWQSGKEFPVKGEDFAYLIWHKRECCLGAI